MPAEAAPAITKTVEHSQLVQRTDYLRQHRSFCEKLITVALGDRAEYERSIHVEQQIYDGFFSDADQELMRDFHEVSWDKRSELLSKFQDPRLRTIGARLIYFENPGLLQQEQCQAFDREFASRLLSEEKQNWLTLPKAIEDTDGMLLEAEEGSKAFLTEYREFLTQRLDAAKILFREMPIAGG
jgi:exodeoxyribonuclease-1